MALVLPRNSRFLAFLLIGSALRAVHVPGAAQPVAVCLATAPTRMAIFRRSQLPDTSRSSGNGARLHERDSSRIRATFDTTYADTPTQGEFVFEAQDNGQTLIERQYGGGAQPSILRYRRCPQVEEKQ